MAERITTGRGTLSPRARRCLAVALAASLAVLLAHAATLAFLTDDAYISFRYARNLANGDGLVFNPGTAPVEGYTNFLWVMALAALDLVGIAPERAAHPLTLLLTVGLWTLVAWFSLREAARTRPALWVVAFAPWLLALTRSVAVWSTSGLETRLFEFLVVAGALRLVVECERAAAKRRPGPPWSALLLGLSALTRPDGVLISLAAFAAAVLWCLWRGCLRWPDGIPRIAVWFALVAGHLAFRLSYYGDWLPNTYYAKVGGHSWWGMGATYLATCFVEYQAWLWAIPIAAAFAASDGLRRSPFPIVAAAVVLPHALGIAAIGGDHFEFRPLDLYFPFAYLLVAGGLAVLARRFRRLAAAYAVCLVLGILWLPLEGWRQYPDLYLPGFPGQRAEAAGINRFLEPEATRLGTVPGLRSILGVYSGLLRETTSHFVGVRREELRGFLDSMEPYVTRLVGLVDSGAIPRDTHIALGSVGLAPYQSGLRTLDRLGLNDAAIARQDPRTGKRMMAHQKSATFAYGRERGVDLWAKHGSSLVCHVTERRFFRLLRRAPPAEGGVTWVAGVGDGMYLLAQFPQGAERTLPRFPSLHFEPADGAEVRHRLLEEAVTLLERRLAANPSDHVARLRLAQAFLDSKLPEAALEPFERAIAERPFEVYPYVGAAMALARSGDPRAAIRHQEEAARRATAIGLGPTTARLRAELDRLRGLSPGEGASQEERDDADP